MKKFFQVFGAAAILAASLFSITKTAKAEMATFAEENIPSFDCMKIDGEYVTMARIVDREKFVRYPNTVANETEIFRSSEPLITWNNTLGNGRFEPESRCMTVSTRIDNMVSALAAYHRNIDSGISTEESYMKAIETLQEASRSTEVYGTNLFGQYVDEQIILASDRELGLTSWLKQPITVAGRPTDPDQTVVVTLSPENAVIYNRVLDSFKVRLNAAVGGPDLDPNLLPIEE